MTPATISQLTKQIAQFMIQHQMRCALAESCTGGLIAAHLTQLPGSSKWFDCGLVTYSNPAKMHFLDISAHTLNHHGAVSQETVIAMAEGILKQTQVDFSVAVTGIAGPDGGSIEKPVGTVWFAWASRHYPTHSACHHLQGSRHQIRKTCVSIALQGLLAYAQKLVLI